MTVVHSDMHTHEQFLSVGLRLGLAFFSGFSLDCFVLVLFPFVLLGLVSSVLCQEIGCEKHL